MLFWNVRGLGKKEKDFWEFTEKFDYVGLSETWRKKGHGKE